MAETPPTKTRTTRKVAARKKVPTDDLAAAAKNNLKMVKDQDHLPGTNHGQIKFLGMSLDLLELPEIGEEMTVVVKCVVIERGIRLVDEARRPIGKAKVTSVTRKP